MGCSKVLLGVVIGILIGVAFGIMLLMVPGLIWGAHQ
jgi:hypothetical protein